MVQKYTDSKYIHCELYFVDRDSTVSINSNTNVRVVKGSDKKYQDTKRWVGYLVYMNPKTEERLWKSCKKDKGKGFDFFAIYCFCCLPCISRVDNFDRMVCSKQVSNCSIAAGIFDKRAEPETYTPNSVRKKLLEAGKIRKDIDVVYIPHWPMLPQSKKFVVI